MKDKNNNNFMMLLAFNLFFPMVGLLLFVLAAVVTTAQSAELTGKVVGVHDGGVSPNRRNFRTVSICS